MLKVYKAVLRGTENDEDANFLTKEEAVKYARWYGQKYDTRNYESFADDDFYEESEIVLFKTAEEFAVHRKKRIKEDLLARFEFELNKEERDALEEFL